MFSYAPNKTNIDEANKHLQMLTERVCELEAEVQEKDEAAAKREEEVKAYVNVSHNNFVFCEQLKLFVIASIAKDSYLAMGISLSAISTRSRTNKFRDQRGRTAQLIERPLR